MRKTFAAVTTAVATVLAVVAATAAPAGAAPVIRLSPTAFKAPGGAVKIQSSWLAQNPGWSGCTAAGGNLHCYLPSDIREAYGVDQLPGAG